MPDEVRVPELGESVVEVTIQRWRKEPGQPVQRGEILVDLETDKVNFELSAERDGVLQSVTRAEGETAKVGELLALIADAPVAAVVEPPAPVSEPSQVGGNGHTGAASEVPQAAPSARRLAEELNIDLENVTGTGRGGLITKEDVLSAASAATSVPVQSVPSTAPGPTASPAATVSPDIPAVQTPDRVPAPVLTPAPAAPPPVASSSPPVSVDRRERRERMSRRRQTIAGRLVEAQSTAAMLTTFNEVDMSAVVELRRRRKDAFKERHGVGLGFMSFFTKASIGALKQFPYVNAEVQGDEVLIKEYYDIGIAVGVEEGLVVPVLRDADRKSFAQIEREIGELATRARENKLTISDLQGGTFSITNGGVYGSLMSTPILNTPQVGILGMHAIKDRPIVVNSEVVVRPMMYLALTYDHRIVDGSDAVRFLVRIKEMIEDPETLLLEG